MVLNNSSQYETFSEYLKTLADIKYMEIDEKDINTSTTIFFTAIEKETCRKVLIKRFDKQLDKYHEFKIELFTLSNLNNDNIIKPITFYEDNDYGYIIFPYAEGGDLFNLINSQKIHFDNNLLRNIAFSILSALERIHSQGFIYRDIKFENIVMKRNFNEIQKKIETDDFVLIDFGSCYVESISENLYDFKGTSFYQSPEYIFHRKVTEKFDVFSLGILLYYLASSYLPFDIDYEYDESEYYLIFSEGNIKELFTGKEWNNISQEIKQLIQSMLLFDENARPTAKELLGSDIFYDLISSYDLISQNDENLFL